MATAQLNESSGVWPEGRELLSPIPEEDEAQCLPSVPSTIEDEVVFGPFEEKNDVLLYHPDTGHLVHSIFDLVPLDPAVSPYSWMIENPGKIPEKLQHPVRKRCFSINGENAVEWAIKSLVTKPVDYFLMAISIKCLIRLRYQKLITEQACAGLLFRAVNGDARLWFPIKRAFFPPDFDFVRFPKKRVNQAIIWLYDNVQRCKTMQFMKTLSRITEALMVRSHADGYLVHVDGSRPVAYDLKSQHDIDISDQFMGRQGCSWPFAQVVPAEKADVYGVCEKLKFEEVFGNAEYLARERAALDRDKAARRGAQQSRAFSVEEASEFLNDLSDEMDPEDIPGKS